MGINLTLATDPTKVVFWVGEIELDEIPVLCQEQQACTIFQNGFDWVGVPIREKGWSPIRLTFAIGSAAVDVSASSGFSASGLAAAGQFIVMPSTHVKLQLGREQRFEVYDVTNVDGVGTRLRSGFTYEEAGITIDADVIRRCNGVQLVGRVEVGRFEIGGRSRRYLEGTIDLTMAEWQPLVIFGSAEADAKPFRVGADGFTVFVRVDYVNSVDFKKRGKDALAKKP